MNFSPEGWDRSDLVRRLCHALEVARKTVCKLAPEGYSDPQEPDNTVEPEKVIAETALLLLSASSASYDPKIQNLISRVAELLNPFARSPKAYTGVCFQPALAFDYSIAHACLSRLGYPDADFDALLERSGTADWESAHERLSYRALEQEWVRRMWKGSNPKPSRREKRLLRSSIIAGPADLLSGTREDLYALTHAIMYSTDLGTRPVQFPRSHRLIAAEAEVSVARCLDEQDYDLGGEVLLSWPLLGLKWSPAAVFAFSVLARVEDAAGFLPAPTTRVDRCQTLHGEERTRYLLASAYHTVYVMGLLCSAILRSVRPLTLSTAPARRSSGAAAALFKTLESDPVSPHWMHDFLRIPHHEREELAGFLFGVAAWRAAKKHDLARLYRLLEISQSYDMPIGPLHRQIAELLQRAAIFSKSKAAPPEPSALLA